MKTEIILEYGRAKSRLWARLRKGGMAAAVCVLLWAGWRWGPGLVRRTQMLYWQEKCLAYRADPGEVVCEMDEGPAKKLIAEKPAEFVDFRHKLRPGYSPGTRHDIAAVRMAACWKYLAGLMATHYASPPNFDTGATLFCGERWNSKGQRRLVVVQYLPNAMSEFDFQSQFDVETVVIVPGTLFREPAEVTSTNGYEIWRKNWNIGGLPPARLYAAEADASNPSRFSFRYECWGQHDVVDGVLNDDDSVDLKPRHRPEPPEK